MTKKQFEKNMIEYCGLLRRHAIPRVMVLVFMEELGYSIWQDYVSHHRTRKGLEHGLRKGVRKGEWMAWRLMHIEKEVIGNT